MEYALSWRHYKYNESSKTNANHPPSCPAFERRMLVNLVVRSFSRSRSRQISMNYNAGPSDLEVDGATDGVTHLPIDERQHTGCL